MADEAPTPIRKPRRRKPIRRTRTTRTESPSGIVAQLRSQLAEQVKPCKCCGQTTGNKSQMARDMGVSIMTLNKFLEGREVRSGTIDAAYNYLNKSE